ncbi:hypothetical protein PILCRDRAFT_820872, partial [Piloderma croceum F 1598]
MQRRLSYGDTGAACIKPIEQLYYRSSLRAPALGPSYRVMTFSPFGVTLLRFFLSKRWGTHWFPITEVNKFGELVLQKA